MSDENTSDQAAPENKEKSSSRNILFIVIIVLLLGGLYFWYSSSKTQAEPASISGAIDFNGLSPEDAKNPNLGKIVLKARPHGSETAEFTDTMVNIPFEDRANWEWTEAEAGVTYDLVAEVYYKDFMLKTSRPATATAPATNINLVFNVTIEDIPEEIRPTTAPNEPTQAPGTATVSGVLTINGFVPQGSTVSTFAREADTDDDFVQVKEGIPAVSGTVLEYTEAEPGMTYEYQAEMYTSAGAFIGQSNYLMVTAPAANELIVINSTASAPSQAASISGTIQMNGPVEQNSTVILLQRKSGDAEYTVVERFPASRTLEYSWDEAEAGVTYDITTALQVNEANTATGTVVTVAAPAENVSLTLDSNFNLAPPTQTPTVACGDPDGTNHYNAQVSLAQMESAKKYYLQVGTSAGAHNIFNSSVDPNSTATVFVPANSPHFARYAYTACTDCDINDTSNWSGWSPTLGFHCPQE